MADVSVALKIGGLACILAFFICGLVGVIILVIRKITSKKDEGVEQT